MEGFRSVCEETCGMGGCGNRYCSAHPRYYYRKKKYRRNYDGNKRRPRPEYYEREQTGMRLDTI